MKKLKIIDAIGGHVHVSKGKGKYFKTKDSASPSGHSLLAQIDMTHSGIVTRNYGFYLPARMKAGASSFMKDYNKPVLIGHDEVADTKPVGRVINAEYVDTSDFYKSNDSYLRKLFQFKDGAEKDTMLDFVQHVIKEYDSKDSYKGLGHLRGTVKLTDAEAIEGILNETYLTVSTSMISDSATCSVCGTDWVRDGLCDHSRGQTYDDDVCVVVPGSMMYDHLGIVNAPADPHAHNFTIVSDDPQEKTIFSIDSTDKDLYKIHNDYEIAAQLFACNDKNIVSLSSETDINLIEIKDNIQKMENAMKEKTIEERVKDALDIKVEVYRYSNENLGSKEITVREYMQDLNVEGVQAMVAQIATMLKTGDKASEDDIKKVVDEYCTKNFELAITKTEDDLAAIEDSTNKGFFGEVLYGEEILVNEDTSHKGDEGKVMTKKKRKKKTSKKVSDKFKLESGEDITFDSIKAEADELLKVKDSGLDHEEVSELSEYIALYKSEDAIILATFNWKDKTHEDMAKEYKAWKDSLIVLDDKSGDEIYTEMKEVLGEDAMSEETYGNLKASDYCGMKGYFPVVDQAHLGAALAVLRKCKAADSVKGRILSAIYRKANRLQLDLTDNFDSKSESCNNNASISNDDAVKAFEDAKEKLIELGIEIPELMEGLKTDQDSEIDILEAQLEAANEELDSVVEENNLLKVQLSSELAIRTVDMKMLSGNFEIKDRVQEIEDHKERSLDSLKDGLKDLETQFKINDFVKDGGMKQAPSEDIEDPTLSQKDSKSGQAVGSETNTEEQKKFKLYDEYNKKVATYGKPNADRWLARVQKQNGSIPTID
jgi:hypothetical protein